MGLKVRAQLFYFIFACSYNYLDSVNDTRASTPDPARADEGSDLSDPEDPEATGDLPNDSPPSPSANLPPPSHSPPQHIPATAVDERQPQIDDIRTKYHPRSNRSTTITPFDEYGRAEQERKVPFDLASFPWLPFQTRIDFEVADLVHNLAMSKAQTETFLSLMRRCFSGEQVKIKNHKDLVETWDKCTSQHAPVCG